MQNKQIQNLTPSLHHLCATAECYLESHWAAQILGTDAPEDEDGGKWGLNQPNGQLSLIRMIVLRLLRAFPYYENYVDLTQMELSALHAVKPLPPKKIAFIGSGPLPLTSICLCQALDKVNGGQGSTTVLNIDKNPEAVKQSRALAERLGISARGMQFSCEVAGSANLDLRGFDAVYLAALVGTTQEEKERVLIEIVKGMTVGSLLVIRTGHGLRSLLYPVRIASRAGRKSEEELLTVVGIRCYDESCSRLLGDLFGSPSVRACCQFCDCRESEA